ncbi:MAG: tRNA lysidine(34) synthetase TilS [Azoarcus sp.]|jgi:tRNA(Ile)-lysidine synthase|nr:tRNA lysidine(34) synthetase TilS [Azoarcus sp.]
MILPLFDAVAAVLAEAGIGAGARLCCALSGGVDSVVLVDALAGVRGSFGFVLEAAHVNHGLQAQADDWQRFCEVLCRERDIPLHVFRVDVVRDHPDGLEAAARLARYAALAEVACDWLVFGHHRDDQAETVLFRLLRGAGVRGMAAMAAIEREGARRLRPLLGLGRAEILAHARARGLAWVEDASNADPVFARNDLRHRILPAIETRFPGARRTLTRAGAHFAEAAALLDDLAGLDAAACADEGGSFARSALLMLSRPRLANLLRWTIRGQGARVPATARLDEALRQLCATGSPLALPLGELVCYSYRGRVWLAPAALATPSSRRWLATTGVAEWGGGCVYCRAAQGAGVAASALEDAECRLSPRAPGLKLRLGAARPARSLKNLCQERGIPPWLRERLPVLEVNGRIAWVGGIGVDAAFACAPGAAGWTLEWRPDVSLSTPSAIAPVPPPSVSASC